VVLTVPVDVWSISMNIKQLNTIMMVQGSFITFNVVTDFILDVKDLSYGTSERKLEDQCIVGMDSVS
jgi:hypothetical protein